jgi:lipopolysaccharide biosynthesis regulator YciM
VHLLIGQAFGMLGEHQAAVEAMELCVVQAPAWRAAQDALMAAYRAAGRPEQADALEARIRDAG